MWSSKFIILDVLDWNIQTIVNISTTTSKTFLSLELNKGMQTSGVTFSDNKRVWGEEEDCEVKGWTIRCVKWMAGDLGAPAAPAWRWLAAGCLRHGIDAALLGDGRQVPRHINGPGGGVGGGGAVRRASHSSTPSTTPSPTPHHHNSRYFPHLSFTYCDCLTTFPNNVCCKFCRTYTLAVQYFTSLL